MEATESKKILADNVCLARKVLPTIAVCPRPTIMPRGPDHSLSQE